MCSFPSEILIGEDGGTDRTREICLAYQNRYPQRIKLILQEQNVGSGANWASLVQAAKGRYIACCDDDDFWHLPEKLQRQVQYLDAHAECGVLHTDYDILHLPSGRQEKSVLNRLNRPVPQGFIQQDVFHGRAKICISTACIRKELIDRHLLLDDYIRLRFPIQDWPTWMILSRFAQINLLPISTTTYRKGHAAITNQQNYEGIEKKFALEQQMYKYICRLFPQELVYDEEKYRLFVNNNLLALAYKKGDFAAAQQFAAVMRKSGLGSLRIRCSSHPLLFAAYRLLKRLRQQAVYQPSGRRPLLRG
jgi:glycosyltransferase involved in cell wall biosynthesis